MKKKQIANQEVVWEARSFSDDYQAALKEGGVFDLSLWPCIQISGPDAWDYLHRMSTLDFRAFPVGKVAPGAFLTGKAVPVVWGFFIKNADQSFLYLVPPGQGELAYEHLEKFHFAENLTVTDVSSDWKAVGIWQAKPRAAATPAGAFSWVDPFRSALTWTLLPKDKFAAFVDTLGLPSLGYRLFEFFRLDAGVVAVGSETTDKTLALEAGLDASISPQKGCYPGQEVVERIHTYGRVNRRLARLELTIPAGLPALPLELQTLEGKAAGTLVAAEVLPDDPSRAYGMGYILRAFLDQPDGQPFHSSASEKLEARLR